jgi:hypothetical protein
MKDTLQDISKGKFPRYSAGKYIFKTELCTPEKRVSNQQFSLNHVFFNFCPTPACSVGPVSLTSHQFPGWEPFLAF